VTVTIRLADPSDAPPIRSIYAPVVAETAISFESDPPTETEMRERIASTLPDHPWLVCERSGSVAGYAAASPFKDRDAYRWAVDVSVYVAAERRREGVGRGLYEALLTVLERQGFCSAHAVIALPNPASVGLHESVGFERVGLHEAVGYKRGEWRDVGRWERSLRERPADPTEPISVASLTGESLEAAFAAGERVVAD
jgi:phosphinothricin acetyltransferase